jgi:hypothetical protein
MSTPEPGLPVDAGPPPGPVSGEPSQGPVPAKGSYPSPMAYAGLGMMNAVLLMGGGLLGYFADRALHTLPLLLLAGLVLGGGLGVVATRSELRRYQR